MKSLFLLLVAAVGIDAARFQENPILTPQSSPSIGSNLNGPSLIHAPDWLKHPLGRYYLYFAHHRGDYIRLATADRLAGPWKVYEPGGLQLSEAPACRDHIASPDVHVDKVRQEVRMYFHCPTSSARGDVQRTFLAVSKDGLRFQAGSAPLGAPYFRVFQWGGAHYAIARLGVLYRSLDGRSDFEQGPNLFRGGSDSPAVRHTAVKVDGNTLSIFYSRIGDAPERILVSAIDLVPDWKKWIPSEPLNVMEPEMEYEGSNLPIQASKKGAAAGRVRQLRDPAIFTDEGKSYLLYSVAGESGIGIAELRQR